MATSFPPSTAMTVWSIILDVVTFFSSAALLVPGNGVNPGCLNSLFLISNPLFFPASNRLIHRLIVLDSGIPPIK
ncbi:hypothetical protein YC2023_118413 [Brassica napus]